MIGLMIGKKCIRGYELKVLKSGGGYYIGTQTAEGEPNCRVSMYYANTEDGARFLIEDRGYASEVKYCNHCLGCFGGCADENE